MCSLNRGAAWAAEPVRTGVKNRKTPVLVDIRTQDHPGRSVVTIPTELSRLQNVRQVRFNIKIFLF